MRFIRRLSSTSRKSIFRSPQPASIVESLSALSTITTRSIPGVDDKVRSLRSSRQLSVEVTEAVIKAEPQPSAPLPPIPVPNEISATNVINVGGVNLPAQPLRIADPEILGPLPPHKKPARPGCLPSVPGLNQSLGTRQSQTRPQHPQLKMHCARRQPAMPAAQRTRVRRENPAAPGMLGQPSPSTTAAIRQITSGGTQKGTRSAYTAAEDIMGLWKMRRCHTVPSALGHIQTPVLPRMALVCHGAYIHLAADGVYKLERKTFLVLLRYRRRVILSRPNRIWVVSGSCFAPCCHQRRCMPLQSHPGWEKSSQLPLFSSLTQTRKHLSFIHDY